MNSWGHAMHFMDVPTFYPKVRELNENVDGWYLNSLDII